MKNYGFSSAADGKVNIFWTTNPKKTQKTYCLLWLGESLLSFVVVRFIFVAITINIIVIGGFDDILCITFSLRVRPTFSTLFSVAHSWWIKKKCLFVYIFCCVLCLHTQLSTNFCIAFTPQSLCSFCFAIPKCVDFFFCRCCMNKKYFCGVPLGCPQTKELCRIHKKAFHKHISIYHIWNTAHHIPVNMGAFSSFFVYQYLIKMRIWRVE